MRNMFLPASSLSKNVLIVKQLHTSVQQLHQGPHQEHQVLHQIQEGPAQQGMTAIAVLIGIAGNVDDALKDACHHVLRL